MTLIVGLVEQASLLLLPQRIHSRAQKGQWANSRANFSGKVFENIGDALGLGLDVRRLVDNILERLREVRNLNPCCVDSVLHLAEVAYKRGEFSLVPLRDVANSLTCFLGFSGDAAEFGFEFV